MRYIIYTDLDGTVRYLLDQSGNPWRFKSKKSARQFMSQYGGDFDYKLVREIK